MSIEADPATAVHAPGPAGPWVAVCRLQDLVPERGAAALVQGEQVALFLLVDGTVRAVQHQDPFTGAHVLARGIVGTRGTTPTVASPLHKQVFDLRTGVCLDPADGPTLRSWAVRVEDGLVLVADAPRNGGPS
ncbi:nitrite reductase small subunit NirD [Actinotalea sp. C106]|uniref:nitrite reductase small subunit NirD n=1 Tax=Actinotalea sp. C106 TaxID=2908644 RepID=UPI002028A44E|nr:nitrite reductase small subunit NirD [Actinotalea sp. C106]